ncbi:MAG: type III pantothenate kinase [Saprospiraceae bacterium]|nr:type III pantothenate kinase [Saprospiraceae bacterium]
MNLAIDIGNTRIKIGAFKGEHLERTWTLDRAGLEELSRLMTNQNVENVILSNVGKPLKPLPSGQYRLLTLDAKTPLPFNLDYRTPETLGQDRLAAVAGAQQLFPGQSSVVIDAGTCVTYDFLVEGRLHLGGNISPGLDMRFAALHELTARLPRLRPARTEHWIGNSTESAMRNGVQEGLSFEMEAMLDRAVAEMGRINVILTGGDAEFFAKRLKRKIFVNQNLVLIGLNKILTHNVEHSE